MFLHRRFFETIPGARIITEKQAIKCVNSRNMVFTSSAAIPYPPRELEFMQHYSRITEYREVPKDLDMFRVGSWNYDSHMVTRYILFLGTYPNHIGTALERMIAYNYEDLFESALDDLPMRGSYIRNNTFNLKLHDAMYVFYNNVALVDFVETARGKHFVWFTTVPTKEELISMGPHFYDVWGPADLDEVMEEVNE